VEDCRTAPSAGKFGGRPRTTTSARCVNAIFYLLRTGCAWRLLPHDFPPGGDQSTITSSVVP